MNVSKKMMSKNKFSNKNKNKTHILLLYNIDCIS